MRIFRAFYDKVGIFVGVLIAFSSALILAEVFLRSFCGKTLYVTDEYAGYIMAIISFWGLSYAEIYDSHIRIDLIDRIESPKVKKVLAKVRYLAGLVFSVFLTYVLVLMFMESYTYNAVSLQISETPLAVPQFLLVLGGGLLVLVYGFKLIAGEK